MASLATPAQLGAFLQQPLTDTDATALLLLDIASGMVRDFLQAKLDLVTNEVVILDPVNGVYLFLPELPVISVTLLETFDATLAVPAWVMADPLTYMVSTRMGVIAAIPNTGVKWPSAPGTWRVTYTHGFATIPMTIVGTVLGAAARAYSSPAGVDMERIGGYQVKYSMETGGFTPSEKKALGRYVNPRLA